MSAHCEYSYAKADWRVEDFAGLARVFDVDAAKLPEWHKCLHGQGRMWDVARRRFGVRPLLGCEDPLEMSALGAEVVAEIFEMEVAEVESLLAQAVSVWKRWGGSVNTVPVQEEIGEAEAEALLLDFGFIEIREPAQRQYLARRIKELTPILSNGDAKTKARAMLATELMLSFDIEAQMRAISRKMKEAREGKTAEPSANYEERFSKLVKTHGEMQESIMASSKELGLSELQNIGGKKKFNFLECIGQMVEALRLWKSEGDRTLIDGIHQYGEVLILTTPYSDRKAQYRPDLPVMLSAWQEGMWDPEAKFGGLPQKANRRLKMAFASGLSAAIADEGAVMPELDDTDDEPATVAEVSQVPAAMQVTQGQAVAPTMPMPARAPSSSSGDEVVF